MATCIDLTYGRAISTALAVEAKYAGTGKSKGFGGDRPSQGLVKRQRFVIRPSNQNRSFSRPPSFPFKQPVFIRPNNAPTASSQPGAQALDSLLCPAHQLDVSIVENLAFYQGLPLSKAEPVKQSARIWEFISSQGKYYGQEY
jgi:hypothetical protein